MLFVAENGLEFGEASRIFFISYFSYRPTYQIFILHQGFVSISFLLSHVVFAVVTLIFKQDPFMKKALKTLCFFVTFFFLLSRVQCSGVLELWEDFLLS